MIQFVPLQEALELVEQSILKGNSLSVSLLENPMFDNRIISLVKVAEETNQTEYVFKQLNEQYNEEVSKSVKNNDYNFRAFYYSVCRCYCSNIINCDVLANVSAE